MPDLTNSVGKHGCVINYDNSLPASNTYGVRSMLERAASSVPVGSGYLVDPQGRSRSFSVLCVDYKSSWYRSPQAGPRYVISPKDTGWVLRAVAPFMRAGMKPAFAHRSRSVPFGGGKWVHAPEWASWVQTRWVCPNCIPRMVEVPGGRRWDNSGCSPQCDVSSSPNSTWVNRHGYDLRIMIPWVPDLVPRSTNQVCDPLADQPGTGLTDNPVCLPAPIAEVQECRTPHNETAEKYWEDFWSEVGVAIRRYNEASEKAARAAAIANQPPPPVPPPPPVMAPPPAPEEVPSVLPVVIVGAAVLAASAILLRRRHIE